MEGYTSLYFKCREVFRKLKLIGRDKKVLLKILEGKRMKRVLDIGCGDAKLLEQLIRKGIVEEGYGIDISDTYKGNLVKFFKGNAEELPFQDDFFDGVFCFHLLEHLQNPRKCIKEMKRVLKSGGKAYIIVPKEIFRGSSAIMASIALTILKRKLILPWKIHLHKFSKKDLLELFKDWKKVSVEEIPGDGLGKVFLLMAEK